MFQLLGIAVMLGVSFASREDARRLGIVVAVGALFLLFLVPIFGVEKNGARRWLEFGMSLQPSEFLKPGFAILLAWMLSWRLRDPGLPVLGYATLTMALVAAAVMAFIILSTPAPMSFKVFVTAATGSNLPQL